MQEQKYRYFIDGKEVDNRTDYFNTTMSGDYVSYFDGDSVFSVSFSNFFDGDFKSSRQINDHVKDILDLGQIKGSSTRHKSQNGETHVEKKELTYQSFYQVVYTKPASNWNKFEITFSDDDLEKIKNLSIGDIKEMFNSTISAEKTENKEKPYFETILNKQLEECLKTPLEKTEKELEFKSLSELYIQGIGKVFVVEAKSREPLVGKNVLINGGRYKVKGVEIQGYIEAGKKIGLLVSKIAEKENKTEENLVFPKDSEIHKEELPPFTTNHPDDYFKRLMDVYAGNVQKYYAVNEGVNEGVKRNNEGVKESNGKTDYSEIDWDFIEGLAKRMNKNKDKYEPFNYHKPMDVNLLKQSLLRHIIEILKGEHNDAGQEYGHLFAVALNAQMIYYQLKNNS